MATSEQEIQRISNFIWGIADDVLRDVFVRGKYRDVILPMTVLYRLDTALLPTKQAVLAMHEKLDQMGIVEQEPALRKESGLPFFNTSKFSLADLRNRGNKQQLLADFEDWLDGFSKNVQDIIKNFKFRNQLETLSDADAIGTLLKFLTRSPSSLTWVPRWELCSKTSSVASTRTTTKKQVSTGHRDVVS